MKRLFISFAFISLFLLINIGGVHAKIPILITYQGYLTDLEDNPVSISVEMTFRIYDTQTGGEPLWEETQGVIVYNGFFSVNLGAVTTLEKDVFIGEEIYLGITVEGDEEMTPRDRFTSLVYSVLCGDADTVDGIDSEDFALKSEMSTTTASFTDLEGKIADSQIPDEIARDSEIQSLTTVDLTKLKSLVSSDFHNLGGTDQDTKLSDGDISGMGYLKNYTETDPTVDLPKLRSLVTNDFHNLGGVDQNTNLSDADISGMGYIKSYTEIDPTVDLQKLQSLVTNDFHNLGGDDLDTHLSDSDITNMGYIKSANETDPKVGTITAGYSPKWDGSALVTGSVYQDASGNVGIGTTSPGGEIDVRDVIVLEEEQSCPDGYTKTKDIEPVEEDNAGDICTADTGFTVKDGNVGIGTTGPGAKLEVKEADGGQREVLRIYSRAQGQGDGPYLTFFGQEDTNYYGAIGAHDEGFGQAGILFKVAPSWTSALSSLTDAMLIDNKGNVGIGTMNPTEKLEVSGTIKATEFVGDGSGLTGISGSSQWASGTNEIYYSGNVGIGTTSPAVQLEIFGSTAKIRASADNSNYTELGADGLTAYFDVVGLGNQYDIRFDSSPTLTVLDSGNVGIGTTSPSEKLEVSGTVKATAFSGNGSGLTGISGDDLGDHTATQNINLSGNWLSGDGGSEGVYVDNSGNVGIGTTSPSSILHLRTSETPDQIRLDRSVDGKAIVMYIDADKAAFFSEGNIPVSLNASGSIDLQVANSGNVGIGTTSPSEKLEVSGTVKATAFSGDGSGLTGISGDGLGDHTATQNINLGGNWLSGDGGSEGVYVDNAGKVGIGTTSPEFKLSLDDDAGIIANGTGGSGTILTTSGAGARLIWYPRKGAFRAGIVFDTQWDDANIGGTSFAAGYGTKASGSSSTALGDQTVASGSRSTAIGNASFATANRSTAIGYYSTASGSSSLAAGHFVTAGTAENTIVLGQGVDFSNRLINNTASSLMVGFNSTVPTLFVGPSSGIGTTGKVGIGTTNPGTPLHVKSSAKTKDGGLRLEDTDETIAWDTFIDTNNFLNFQYSTTNSPAMTITTNGNVGIGTTSPSEKLEVKDGNLIINNGSVGIGTFAPKNKLDVEGSMAVGATYSGTSSAPGNGMIIEGNVGIGTTNPAAQLEIFGTSAKIRASADASNYTELGADGLTAYFDIAGLGNQYDIRFDGNPKLSVLDGGNVGIGTTSPDSPLYIESSQGPSSTTPMLALNNTAASGQTMLDFKDQGITKGRLRIAGGGGAFFIQGEYNSELRFITGDSVRMTVENTGNVGIGTTSPSATLDINGYYKLAKNTTQPVACSATYDGSVALTSGYRLCVCKGGTSTWVFASDGTTSCTW